MTWDDLLVWAQIGISSAREVRDMGPAEYDRLVEEVACLAEAGPSGLDP